MIVRKIILHWVAVILILIGFAAVAVPNFLRARERSRATSVLNEARMLDGAINQWAIEQSKKPKDKVTYQDIIGYLRPNSNVVRSGGKDLWGNPYIFGPTVEDGVKFGPETLLRYDTSVVPAAFWEDFR